jgi:hypothetical protein
LKYWKERFSCTWTLYALAALLQYIADIRYMYVIARENFEANNLIDIFWTFSPILFNVGAAWE